MPERYPFDYAVVRVVPRVERGELVNAGVILSSQEARFLDALVELNEARVLALDPHADLDEIRACLEAIPVVCAGGEAAGPIGRLPQRARFNWLVAPRSTIVQTSPQHGGLCADPAAQLEKLFKALVTTE
jgi:hypothetical protein